jgi:hypothetical protein
MFIASPKLGSKGGTNVQGVHARNSSDRDVRTFAEFLESNLKGSRP